MSPYTQEETNFIISFINNHIKSGKDKITLDISNLIHLFNEKFPIRSESSIRSKSNNVYKFQKGENGLIPLKPVSTERSKMTNQEEGNLIPQLQKKIQELEEEKKSCSESLLERLEKLEKKGTLEMHQNDNFMDEEDEYDGQKKARTSTTTISTSYSNDLQLPQEQQPEKQQLQEQHHYFCQPQQQQQQQQHHNHHEPQRQYPNSPTPSVQTTISIDSEDSKYILYYHEKQSSPIPKPFEVHCEVNERRETVYSKLYHLIFPFTPQFEIKAVKLNLFGGYHNILHVIFKDNFSANDYYLLSKDPLIQAKVILDINKQHCQEKSLAYTITLPEDWVISDIKHKTIPMKFSAVEVKYSKK